MNIKKLKEEIKDLPDDMQVVVPGYDHHYTLCASAVAVDAEYDPNYEVLTECYLYDGYVLENNIQIKKVLVIG